MAFGAGTVASGNGSASFGIGNQANGTAALAGGLNSFAIGQSSFAYGIGNMAQASASSAFGEGANANTIAGFAIGRYNGLANISVDPANPQALDPVFQIGNGSAYDDRKNAFTVLRNGSTRIGISKSIPEFLLDIGGRARIRHNGNSAGIYFNNSQNIADGFIGMKSDTELGMFMGSGWKFYVDNTGTGHLSGSLQQNSG